MRMASSTSASVRGREDSSTYGLWMALRIPMSSPGVMGMEQSWIFFLSTFWIAYSSTEILSCSAHTFRTHCHRVRSPFSNLHHVRHRLLDKGCRLLHIGCSGQVLCSGGNQVANERAPVSAQPSIQHRVALKKGGYRPANTFNTLDIHFGRLLNVFILEPSIPKVHFMSLTLAEGGVVIHTSSSS